MTSSRLPQMPEAVAPLLRQVADWASARPEVHAVLLLGSHARGEARMDSDVDLMLLVDDPRPFTASWSWAAAFGEAERCCWESWGAVTSLRVWYVDGHEVEFGLATPEWARQPLDAGTAEVLRQGFVPLHDPEGFFRWLDEVHPAAPNSP